jgi:RNA polymerase sigma-70 factor, ECF subfamily
MSDRASDEELVARAERGEHAAFEELASRYFEEVVSAAYAVLSNFDLARDCAQEAFTEAVITLSRLRDRTKFRAWIYGISRRKAIYVLRRQRLHGEAIKVKTDESRRMPVMNTPSEQASHEEKLESIRRALAELPFIYREVLTLKYIDGRSHDDIAKLLDVSLAAVDKRLMRGKDMLRESLKRWASDD